MSARDRLFEVFAADSVGADSGAELVVDIRRESSEMNGLNYVMFDSELNKVESILTWRRVFGLFGGSVVFSLFCD